jgi:hypothetical protein
MTASPAWPRPRLISAISRATSACPGARKAARRAITSACALASLLVECRGEAQERIRHAGRRVRDRHGRQPARLDLGQGRLQDEVARAEGELAAEDRLGLLGIAELQFEGGERGDEAGGIAAVQVDQGAHLLVRLGQAVGEHQHDGGMVSLDALERAGGTGVAQDRHGPLDVAGAEGDPASKDRLGEGQQFALADAVHLLRGGGEITRLHVLGREQQPGLAEAGVDLDQALRQGQRLCIVADAQAQDEDLAAELEIVGITRQGVGEILGGKAQFAVIEGDAAGEVARREAVAVIEGGTQRGTGAQRLGGVARGVGTAGGRLREVAAGGGQRGDDGPQQDRSRRAVPTTRRRPKGHERLQFAGNFRRIPARGPLPRGWQPVVADAKRLDDLRRPRHKQERFRAVA